MSWATLKSRSIVGCSLYTASNYNDKYSSPKDSPPPISNTRFTSSQIAFVKEYLFHPESYAAAYDDIARAYGKGDTPESRQKLWEHFETFVLKGSENRFKFSCVWDYEYYISKNPDLRGFSPVEAMILFINFGHNEFRQTHPNFNINIYSQAKDLKTAFGDNWKLYFKHRINFFHENRTTK